MDLRSNKINIPLLISLIGTGILALYLYKRCLLCGSYATDLGGVEESPLMALQRLYHHLSIYGDPEKFPFFTYQHPPLFSWLLAGICDILKINPLVNVRETYITGRVISLTSNVLSAGLIYLILQQFKVRKFIGFFIAVLSLLFLTRHNYALRPDSLKSFLVLLYLFLFLRSIKSEKFPFYLYILLGIIPFVKQDSFILIFGSFAYFIKTKNYPEVKKIIGITGITGLSILSLLLYENGSIFFKNIIGTNLEFLDLVPFSYTAFAFIKKDSILLLFYGLFIVHYYRKNNSDKSILFLLLQSFFILFFSFLFSFKFGSDIVYFTDIQNILLIITGLTIHQFLKEGKETVRTLVATLVILLIFTFHQYIMLKSQGTPLFNTPEQETGYQLRFNKIEHFSKQIKQTIKKDEFIYILDINFAPFFSESNCMFGYPYVYNQFLYLASNNFPIEYVVDIFDSAANFKEMFKNKKVSYVIIPNNEKGLYLYSKFYSDFQPYLTNTDFILLRIRNK